MENYKKLLEKAQKAYKNCVTGAEKRRLESIFPELKENDDEMIREEIVDYLKDFIPHNDLDLVRKSKVWIEWLEKQGEQKETNLVEILKHYPRETELYSPLYGKLWLAEADEKHEIITCYKHPLDEGCTRATLEQEDTVSFYSNGTTGLPDFSVSEDCMLFLYDSEKQGEQKPVEKDNPKFKVGDWVISPGGCYLHILDIKKDGYLCKDILGEEVKVLCEHSNSDYKLWTIQDAKDGDLLADDYGIYIFDTFDEYDERCYFCKGAYQYSQKEYENEHMICSVEAHPATKEQRDLLFQKMKEAGYEWDGEKKELKKIEQKLTWSRFEDIIDDLEYDGHLCTSQIKWLKSLKERFTLNK